MAEYKGYDIVGDGTFGYKRIKPIGKGSVHKELRESIYTTESFAKRAIDTFLATQPKKVAKKEEVEDAKSQ